MRQPAGKRDRRITVEIATPVKDAAGDPVNEWAFAFKLFASWSARSVG